MQPVIMGLQLALTELWRSLRSHPGCGDRPFHGRGHRRRGGRGADRGRGTAADRDPLPVDGPAGRAGRGGPAGTGRRGHRGLDRRPPAGQCGGLCLTAPNRDRRTTRRRRRRHRRGQRPGSLRQAGEHGSRLPHRIDGSNPARTAVSPGRPGTQSTQHSVHLHRARHHRPACWMPTTGWTTCANPYDCTRQ